MGEGEVVRKRSHLWIRWVEKRLEVAVGEVAVVVLQLLEAQQANLPLQVQAQAQTPWRQREHRRTQLWHR